MVHKAYYRAVLCVFGVALTSSPIAGQAVATGQSGIVFEASLDVPSRYVFRGYELDERGAVFQPAVGVSKELSSWETGTVRELSASALVWSSVHAGSRAYPGDLGVYEVDLGLSLDATLSNGRSASLVYTAYFAPTGAFGAIHELGLEVGLGVVGNEGLLHFSPRILVAQEFYDRGGPEDTYLEAGGDLGLPSIGALNWTVPVVVGMSVDGFYRNANDGNEWLGFVGTGVEASASLEDLGLGGSPVDLIVGVNVAFANRDAQLTHAPANDVLWTTQVGLSVAR